MRARLIPHQMRWQIDYTAQQCSGIGYRYRDADHIEKRFVFGGPARSGVTSALLAEAEWTGVPDAVSGQDNFLVARPTADAHLLVDELAMRYEVVRINPQSFTYPSLPTYLAAAGIAAGFLRSAVHRSFGI